MKKLILFLSLLLISFSGFSQSRYISETIKKIEEAILIQNGILEEENNYSVKVMDKKYVQEILISIGQLEKLSKEINQPIRAKKVLLEELMKYCQSFGKDYKEVISEFKQTMVTKNKNDKEILICA